MGYARRDVDETKKYAKKFVRYPEGAEKYSIGLTKFQELAKEGEPVFREYKVDIVDEQQKVIATVTKTLYIRLRKYSKSKDQTNRIDNLES